MKNIFRRLVVLIVLLNVSGCSDSKDKRCGCGDGDLMEPGRQATTSPWPGAWVEIVADRDPVVGGTATLTLRYQFRYHESICDTMTLIAMGGLREPFTDIWSFVSDDTSFVDTVKCFETREHSFVLRFHRKGQLLIDGLVGAPIDSSRSLGGKDTICLCVK